MRSSRRSPGAARCVPALTFVTWAASAAVALVGLAVLLGWALDVAVLRSLIPGLVAMNPTTAFSFVVAAGATWLLRADRPPSWSRPLALACACALILVGVLRLGEILLGWPSDTSHLLFGQQVRDVTTFTGNRIAPATALNLVLVGVSLALLHTRRHYRTAHVLVCVALVVALLALLGYLYGITALYRVSSLTPIALNTTLAFVTLCAGILSAHPERGVMALACGRGAGGVVLRRLLPAAVAIPAVVGWLRLEGQRAGLYTTEFGTALMVVSTIVLSALLIGWTARSLDQADAERTRAEVKSRSFCKRGPLW